MTISAALKKILSNLPDDPGIYKMLDVDKTILYVGKAKNLRKRVSSYFSSSSKTKRISEMIKQIHDIELTSVLTEKEAILLEAQIIKSIKPKYNVALKYSKDKKYIVIHDEKKPVVFIQNGFNKDAFLCAGPFHSYEQANDMLNFVLKIHPLRTCSNSFFSNRSRPCLQYEIKKCLAPCVFKSDEKMQENTENALKIRNIFEQGFLKILPLLKKEMMMASQDLNFERAIEIKEKVDSIVHLSEKQYVQNFKKNIDVFSFYTHEHMSSMSVISYRNGFNLGAEHFIFEEEIEDLDFFITEKIWSYMQSKKTQDQIMCDQLSNSKNLSDMLGKKISKSKTTAEKAIANIGLQNAILYLKTHAIDTMNLSSKWTQMEEFLGIKVKSIEAFDISHFSGSGTTGSCISYTVNGPNKNNYRAFPIKTRKSGDDYEGMKILIYTRFKNRKTELPEVLLIDGGEGQIASCNAALAELKEAGQYQSWNPIVVGIRKAEKRKLGAEFILFNGKEYRLGPDSDILNVFIRARDESHRFALVNQTKKNKIINKKLHKTI